MRASYALAAIALLTFAATTARAQISNALDRARDGAARAGENSDDRANVAADIERGRLNLSADPAAHLEANPNTANLGANARIDANLPPPAVNSNVAAPAPVVDPNRWRYVRHNNQWWYYTPSNTWMYHRDNVWNNYNAATYVEPRYTTGYRGYNYQRNNRRYNYIPEVRARANVNGVGAQGRVISPGSGVGASGGAIVGPRVP